MNWLAAGSVMLSLGYPAAAHAATSPASVQEPVKVSICTVLKDPGAYNHQLIEVSGKVSRGFEDFTLTDGCHITSAAIWLDLGGTKGAQVMYCCGGTTEPRRERSLVIEGVATTLVQDDKFQRFQTLTRGKSGHGGEATATLVGWFFSGKKQVLPGGPRWMGYGHMGFFSLLVIQQVIAVGKQ